MGIPIKKQGQRLFVLRPEALPQAVPEVKHAAMVVRKVRRMTEQQISNIRFNLQHDANKRAANYLEAKHANK